MPHYCRKWAFLKFVGELKETERSFRHITRIVFVNMTYACLMMRD